MNQKCPLNNDFESAANLGLELAKTMRRIRRKLKSCDKCEYIDNCGIRNKFNCRVDGLIAEINEEWNLMARARSSEARASEHE